VLYLFGFKCLKLFSLCYLIKLPIVNNVYKTHKHYIIYIALILYYGVLDHIIEYTASIALRRSGGTRKVKIVYVHYLYLVGVVFFNTFKCREESHRFGYLYIGSWSNICPNTYRKCYIMFYFNLIFTLLQY